MEQYVLANTSILVLIMITTWIYLGYRLYKAMTKRRLEKQYITLATLKTGNDHQRTNKVTHRGSSPMPDLTDTDISDTSSEEDNSDSDSDSETNESTYITIEVVD